jgi:hypothetical protein
MWANFQRIVEVFTQKIHKVTEERSRIRILSERYGTDPLIPDRIRIRIKMSRIPSTAPLVRDLIF